MNESCLELNDPGNAWLNEAEAQVEDVGVGVGLVNLLLLPLHQLFFFVLFLFVLFCQFFQLILHGLCFLPEWLQFREGTKLTLEEISTERQQ